MVLDKFLEDKRAGPKLGLFLEKEVGEKPWIFLFLNLEM